MQQNQVHKDEFQPKEIVSLAHFYWPKLKQPDKLNTQIKSHIHNVLKIKAILNSGTGNCNNDLVLPPLYPSVEVQK